MQVIDCIPIIEGFSNVVYTALAALLIYYYAVYRRRWAVLLGKALLLAAMMIPPLAHMSDWTAEKSKQNAPEVEEMGEIAGDLALSGIAITPFWVLLFRPNRPWKSVFLQFALHYLLQAVVFIAFFYKSSRSVSMAAAERTVCEFPEVITRYIVRLPQNEELSLQWFFGEIWRNYAHTNLFVNYKAAH